MPKKKRPGPGDPITFYRRNTYGTERLYVVNEIEAAVIADLVGKATLSDEDVENFEELGLLFREVPEPIET